MHLPRDRQLLDLHIEELPERGPGYSLLALGGKLQVQASLNHDGHCAPGGLPRVPWGTN